MSLWTDLVALKGCLEAQLDPPVVRLAIVPDVPPVHEDCCDNPRGNGQCTINIVQVSTDNSALQGADPARALSCPPLEMQATVAVEVVRCVPWESPSEVDSQESTVQQFLNDREAVARAVRCCFATDDRSLLLGVWEKLTPQGGCGGGRTEITFGFLDQPCA